MRLANQKVCKQSYKYMVGVVLEIYHTQTKKEGWSRLDKD